MYRHSQVGLSIFLLLVGFAVIGLAAGMATVPVIGISFAVVFVLLAALFYRLVVEVDGHGVRLSFGLGLIRRTIEVSRIAGVDTVRNSWWYGWGIRLTPRGWMWNISGLDAVELTYRNGKHFRIGTDEPAKLARVIRRAAALTEDGE